MTLKEYIEASGMTQTAFAGLLGLPVTNVNAWLRKEKPVPIPWRHCPSIVALTKGKVTYKELRSDWPL